MKEALKTVIISRNTLHNKLFQTLIRVGINLCKQRDVLEIIFALKIRAISQSP